MFSIRWCHAVMLTVCWICCAMHRSVKMWLVSFSIELLQLCAFDFMVICCCCCCRRICDGVVLFLYSFSVSSRFRCCFYAVVCLFAVCPFAVSGVLFGFSSSYFYAVFYWQREARARTHPYLSKTTKTHGPNKQRPDQHMDTHA